MKLSRIQLAKIFVGIAIIGGAIFMYAALNVTRQLPLHATVLPEPKALPVFSLQDHTGKRFDRNTLLGHWSVVFFGFTHCPDICPATLQQLALARSQVDGDVDTKGFPDIVLISVDPERDSPDVMAKYVSHFGEDITGVSGSTDELRKLTDAIGIYFRKSPGDAEQYTVDHSSVVIIINENAQFHALFSAPHKIENFVNDIPLLTEPI